MYSKYWYRHVHVAKARGWGSVQLLSLKLAATCEDGGERHAPFASPLAQNPGNQ